MFRYKTDVMMTGFVAAIIMSHISHGYFGGALNSMLDFLPALAGYYLVAHSLNSERKVKWFMFLLIALTVFLSYEACLQSFYGVAQGGLKPLFQQVTNAAGVQETVLRVRWFGMFNDPNDFGLALILPIPFLINSLFEKKYLLPTACLTPLLYATYQTNSRGAMLALSAAIFIYLIIRFRSTIGAIFAGLLGAFVVVLGPSRMSQLSSGEESAHGRIEAWYAGFQMFKSYPIFGVGMGMFTDYHPLTAHNTYMLVLAELGFLGAFFFAGLFFYPLLWSYNNIFMQTESPENEKKRLLLAACFSSLTGLMAALFFLSRAYIMLPFMIIAFLTATINTLRWPPCVDVALAQGDAVADQFHGLKIASVVLAEIIIINLIVKLCI